MSLLICDTYTVSTSRCSTKSKWALQSGGSPCTTTTQKWHPLPSVAGTRKPCCMLIVPSLLKGWPPSLCPGYGAPVFLNQDQRQQSLKLTFHSFCKKALWKFPSLVRGKVEEYEGGCPGTARSQGRFSQPPMERDFNRRLVRVRHCVPKSGRCTFCYETIPFFSKLGENTY